MHKQGILSFCLWIFLTVFGVVLLTGHVKEKGELSRLNQKVTASAEFREQRLDEELLPFLRETSSPGELVGIYLLESKFGYCNRMKELSRNEFSRLEKKWKTQDAWKDYLETIRSIWDDVCYFPIPESTSSVKLDISYGNSWMGERNYGGQRGHEGTDVIAGKNQRGLYPIISMTDGIVKKKGWLEKGGYRIGIQTTAGAYFYYAHLDSYANLNEGDSVKAGDILGFMGDSGYGPEGTIGQFVVHLHLGIYIYPEGEETSINPYWVLRYIENSKVKCYTEK